MALSPPPGDVGRRRRTARHQAATASIAHRARRRSRIALALLALALLLAGRELAELREIADWNRRIDAVNAAPEQGAAVVARALAAGGGAASAPAPGASAGPAGAASSAASAPPGGAPAWLDADQPPAWRHAEALALAAAGEDEAALARYRSLAEDPVLGLDARYNSANLLMRQALALRATTTPGLAVPLLELAKEGYRQVLRRAPDHWEARYNLERAQRLLPDPEPSDADEAGPPENAERAATTMRGVSQGLP